MSKMYLIPDCVTSRGRRMSVANLSISYPNVSVFRGCPRWLACFFWGPDISRSSQSILEKHPILLSWTSGITAELCWRSISCPYVLIWLSYASCSESYNLALRNHKRQGWHFPLCWHPLLLNYSVYQFQLILQKPQMSHYWTFSRNNVPARSLFGPQPQPLSSQYQDPPLVPWSDHPLGSFRPTLWHH